MSCLSSGVIVNVDGTITIPDDILAKFPNIAMSLVDGTIAISGVDDTVAIQLVGDKISASQINYMLPYYDGYNGIYQESGYTITKEQIANFMSDTKGVNTNLNVMLDDRTEHYDYSENSTQLLDGDLRPIIETIIMGQKIGEGTDTYYIYNPNYNVHLSKNNRRTKLYVEGHLPNHFDLIVYFGDLSSEPNGSFGIYPIHTPQSSSGLAKIETKVIYKDMDGDGTEEALSPNAPYAVETASSIIKVLKDELFFGMSAIQGDILVKDEQITISKDLNIIGNGRLNGYYGEITLLCTAIKDGIVSKGLSSITPKITIFNMSASFVSTRYQLLSESEKVVYLDIYNSDKYVLENSEQFEYTLPLNSSLVYIKEILNLYSPNTITHSDELIIEKNPDGASYTATISDFSLINSLLDIPKISFVKQGTRISTQTVPFEAKNNPAFWDRLQLEKLDSSPEELVLYYRLYDEQVFTELDSSLFGCGVLDISFNDIKNPLNPLSYVTINGDIPTVSNILLALANKGNETFNIDVSVPMRQFDIDVLKSLFDSIKSAYYSLNTNSDAYLSVNGSNNVLYRNKITSLVDNIVANINSGSSSFTIPYHSQNTLNYENGVFSLSIDTTLPLEEITEDSGAYVRYSLVPTEDGKGVTVTFNAYNAEGLDITSKIKTMTFDDKFAFYTGEDF